MMALKSLDVQIQKHQTFSPIKESESVMASSNSIKNKILNLFSKESAEVNIAI